MLTDVRLVAEPSGIVFAAANAVLFALYIVLGHRVASSAQVPGIDGLGLSKRRRSTGRKSGGYG